VAVVILTVGSLMLAGGSLFVTRDLVRSRQATIAAGMAQTQLDDLRARALSTNPPCTSSQFVSSASAASYQGVTMTWVVPTSGVNRSVRVITNYKFNSGRVRIDTLTASIAC
jgi:hypothetical protein